MEQSAKGERVRRSERLAAMTQILTSEPNQVISLGRFCSLFSTAKSTVSEDIALVQRSFELFNLGRIETVVGAAGGVRYRPAYKGAAACEFLETVCRQLETPSRALPGGYLFMADILSQPTVVVRMSEILACRFSPTQPDFVLTMETMGIPVALETARLIGKPLIIARRDSKVYEGPAVKINYASGSGIETMSLSRRSVPTGRGPAGGCQRALIIDDFMKGGGTLRGMQDLMNEFDAEVVGMGVVMTTEQPEVKRVDGALSLMVCADVEEGRGAKVRVADWIRSDAGR